MTGTAGMRVLVLDPQPAVRLGFRYVLEHQPWVEWCGCAADASELADLARQHTPHVAVLDADAALAFANGVTALRPATRIVMAAEGHDLAPGVVGALSHDAVVSKRWDLHRIAAVIKRAGTERGTRAAGVALTALSERELHTLALIAEGCTNAEIARRLHLAADTVKGTTRTLYRKLDVPNRAGAVSAGQRLGLVS